MSKGVYLPKFESKDTKTIQQLVKLGAIAKLVSRSTVSVQVMRDGALVRLTEPIGHEDLILQTLIATRGLETSG